MEHSRRALLGVAVTAAAGAGVLLKPDAAVASPVAAKPQLAGDGRKDDAPRLREMLDALASTGGTLRLPSGEFRLGSDVTVPAGVELAFDGSARLLIDEGATVHVAGRIDAPPRRIFAGRVILSPGASQKLLPQWWGAAGDGATDDTAALQAALDAVREAGGGEVELVRGRYLITNILRLYRGTHLRMDTQAVILRGAATSGIFINGDDGATYPGYEGHGDLTIEGGVLDGNLASFPDPFSAVSIGHAARIVVRGVEIRDVSWAHALEINSSTDVLIEDCRFLGFLDAPDGSRSFSEAIQLDIPTSLSFPAFGAWDGTPTRNVTIRRNLFGASGTAGTTAWPCGVGEHGAVHDVFSGEIRIESNTFRGATYYAVRTFQWRDCQIVGNLFTDCKGGVALSTATPNSLSTKDVDGVQHGESQPNSRVMIADNIFRDVGASGAVAAYGRDHALNEGLQVRGNLVDNCAGSAVRVSFARGMTVQSNTIRNARRGIHVDGVQGALMSGNLITDTVVNAFEITDGGELAIVQNTVQRAGFYGILLSGSASLVHITDNVVHGPSRSEAGRYDGIFLSGTAVGGEVARNHVRPIGDTGLRYGVQIGAANSDLVVSGNTGAPASSALKNLSPTSVDALRLLSPGGTPYLVTVDDAGALSISTQ